MHNHTPPPVLYDRRQTDSKIEQLEERIEELTNTVNTLQQSVQGLVEAWNTAKGVTAFVKWLSGMIVAAGVIIALFKGMKP